MNLIEMTEDEIAELKVGDHVVWSVGGMPDSFFPDDKHKPILYKILAIKANYQQDGSEFMYDVENVTPDHMDFGDIYTNHNYAPTYRACKKIKGTKLARKIYKDYEELEDGFIRIKL
jgi:hypothetical protein